MMLKSNSTGSRTQPSGRYWRPLRSRSRRWRCFVRFGISLSFRTCRKKGRNWKESRGRAHERGPFWLAGRPSDCASRSSDCCAREGGAVESAREEGGAVESAREEGGDCDIAVAFLPPPASSGIYWFLWPRPFFLSRRRNSLAPLLQSPR